jgi:hypothetical protein
MWVVVPFDFHRDGKSPRPVGNWSMEKRTMRIVQEIGQAPFLAICTHCNQQFKAPSNVMQTAKAAMESLEDQFAQHKCKLIDSSQNALRIVRESTEGK